MPRDTIDTVEQSQSSTRETESKKRNKLTLFSREGSRYKRTYPDIPTSGNNPRRKDGIQNHLEKKSASKHRFTCLKSFVSRVLTCSSSQNLHTAKYSPASHFFNFFFIYCFLIFFYQGSCPLFVLESVDMLRSFISPVRVKVLISIFAFGVLIITVCSYAYISIYTCRPFKCREN